MKHVKMYKCFALNQSVVALFTTHHYWWLFWLNLSEDYCESSTYIAAQFINLMQTEKTWCRVDIWLFYSVKYSHYSLSLKVYGMQTEDLWNAFWKLIPLNYLHVLCCDHGIENVVSVLILSSVRYILFNY